MPTGRCCPCLGHVSLERFSQRPIGVSKAESLSHPCSADSSWTFLKDIPGHEQWTYFQAVGRAWCLFTPWPPCQLNLGQQSLQMSDSLKFPTIWWEFHCWQFKKKQDYAHSGWLRMHVCRTHGLQCVNSAISFSFEKFKFTRFVPYVVWLIMIIWGREGSFHCNIISCKTPSGTALTDSGCSQPGHIGIARAVHLPH